MIFKQLLITACLISPAYAFQLSPKPTSPPSRIVSSANKDADYTPSNEHANGRREMLQNAANTVGLALLMTDVIRPQSASADVIRSPGKCANGEGEGCDSLAEGNEFIQNLQKKSSENREANQREALNAYYMKNYPDVFSTYDKRMVKKSDGSFALFSPAEVDDLVKAGKVKIEYPTSKGGRILDLTQKPVLVLVE